MSSKIPNSGTWNELNDRANAVYFQAKQTNTKLDNSKQDFPHNLTSTFQKKDHGQY